MLPLHFASKIAHFDKISLFLLFMHSRAILRAAGMFFECTKHRLTELANVIRGVKFSSLWNSGRPIGKTQ